MSEEKTAKPDLAKGVDIGFIPEGGILAGKVGEASVMLTRRGEAIRAFSAQCTHLKAPLADGLIVDGTVRCPWHHACFDLQTGEALEAPAFDHLQRWTVERSGDQVRVSRPEERPALPARVFEGHSEPGFVIVGGGAAGYAAAHELRRLGHEGPITLVSSDPQPPYDRTLLTKDYLDGEMGDADLPIAAATLQDLAVTYLSGVAVDAIDRKRHDLTLSNGHTLPYTKLLLATGAEPKTLDVPGSELPHVKVLRSLDDCRAILERLTPGAKVVAIGSSFIALEAAASIRSRGFDVTVLTPEAEPMAKILGPDMSRAIMAVHTGQGVVFHVNAKVASIDRTSVSLKDGSKIPADLVVVGIGVRPRTELAEMAGLRVEQGVVVDEHLATSDPDIFAAGDIARWPDPRTGQSIRVEHWVVAERQGQVAARNILGGAEPYDVVPFFWSKHFDFSFRYVGHAERWDQIAIEGDLDARNAVVNYRSNGRTLASVTVEQDLGALLIEERMRAEAAGSASQNRRAKPA